MFTETLPAGLILQEEPGPAHLSLASLLGGEEEAAPLTDWD